VRDGVGGGVEEGRLVPEHIASDVQQPQRGTRREGGANFATKTEVDPVKLLSISDFVNATGTVQRSAGRGAKMPTYRIPHREGLRQMFGDTEVDALTPRQ
jgi:hypothetical protein